MLIQDFYQIKNLSQKEGEIRFSIVLNQTHKVYKGHFPRQPVVPGVIQIQIIKEALEECLKLQLQIKQINQAKYLQLIDPKVNPNLEIEIGYNFIEENLYKINALIRNNDITFSKIRAVLGIRN
jgi:3-hydroxyacyl-[acyl-carrier-protein] dehydratase